MRFPVVFFVIKIFKNLFNITSYIFYQSYLLIAFKAIATYKYLYYENSKKLITLKLMIIIIKIKEKNIMMRLKYSEFKYE